MQQLVCVLATADRQHQALTVGWPPIAATPAALPPCGCCALVWSQVWTGLELCGLHFLKAGVPFRVSGSLSGGAWVHVPSLSQGQLCLLALQGSTQRQASV